MTELKALQSPPADVIKVVAYFVFVVTGKRVTSWVESRNALSQLTFLKQAIQALGPAVQKPSSEILAGMREYKLSGVVDPDDAKCKSVACGGIAKLLKSMVELFEAQGLLSEYSVTMTRPSTSTKKTSSSSRGRSATMR